jgi:hypothetical protein
MLIAKKKISREEREHSARCRWHSAGGFLNGVRLKLSGNMPDRAGKMPALPR